MCAASEDPFAASLRGIKAEQARDLSDGAVVVKAFAPPRFDINNQRAEFLAYLEEHGYAVVAQAADVEAVEHAKSLMWDFLESVPGTEVRRHDVDSWGHHYDWLPSPTNGILSGFGWGQSACMWHVRLLPQVRAAFAAIWGTDDLLVSFDGGNVFRPWRYNPSWLTDGGWYHVDQNATKPGSSGRVCVQGLVTLTSINASTGGLVVVPRSHIDHEELCKRNPYAKDAGDFVPVSHADPVFENGAFLLCAEAGDLLLWDSRTVHCNNPALGALESDAEQPSSGNAGQEGPWELLRQATYVCMTPAQFTSEDILQWRCETFEQGFGTSHWPQKKVRAGAPPPDYCVDPNGISKEQRLLIGYDRARSAPGKRGNAVGCVIA